MLYLDRDSKKNILARTVHLKAVRCRILKKYRNFECRDTGCAVCKSTKYQSKVSLHHLKFLKIITDVDFLNGILTDLPEELMIYSKMIWEEIIPNFTFDELRDYIKSKGKKNKSPYEVVLMDKYKIHHDFFLKVFDYDSWFLNSKNAHHYDAYSLANNLDINTCIYCNRLYTGTVKSWKNEKVMRPTFDHWYSHAMHPILGLSFYNLIPSCSICNSSIKGFSEYCTDTHHHPYVDKDFSKSFRYSYDYYNSNNSYEIKTLYHGHCSKTKRTINDLKLKEVFSNHHIELSDLLKIKEAYSDKYLDNLKDVYSGLPLSTNEAYRLAFGTELEERNFYKRPLSKFKSDILRELGIIV